METSIPGVSRPVAPGLFGTMPPGLIVGISWAAAELTISAAIESPSRTSELYPSSWNRSPASHPNADRRSVRHISREPAACVENPQAIFGRLFESRNVGRELSQKQVR